MSERTFLVRAAPVLVLFGGVLAYWTLSSLGDSAEVKPPPAVPIAVETVTVESGPVRRTVIAQGTVVPARAVQVRPQVSGRVVSENPDLEPGAVFAAGEELLRIEPADYELAVQAAEAEVRRATAELELEKGRRRVAEAEWELFESELADVETNPTLATREPQLAAATAALAAARSRLATARLNLERTAIAAPFAATVLSEQVAVGQTVGPETVVMELAGTDAFWVRIAIPLNELAAIQGGENGSEAEVLLVAGDYVTRRTGRVIQVLSNLDEGTRLARAIVEVENPLTPSDGQPGLLLGSYVSVKMRGSTTRRVAALPESALHAGDTVHIYRDDDTLEVRSVEVAWRDAAKVYVADGIADGEQVITSRVSAPITGMPLRRQTTES